ncbi:MAG: glycosyltransferase family 8 protein [Selenomonadaceae bacterium]|nr:glycosyltransferase family 8 protein [Selenomonadaceae bacterium]
MIHICYSVYDKTGRYSKFAGTSMASIFENTNQDVTIHLLHDNTLTTENRDKFVRLAEKYDQQIEFYNVEILFGDQLKYIVEKIPKVKESHVSIGAFYRLFIAKVLSNDIHKAIYLDSGDTIVNLDIKELWDINLENKPLAAVPEALNKTNPKVTHLYLVLENIVKYEDYFNSGILVMNLDYFRENEEVLKRGINFRVEHSYYEYMDQDILNYCFADDYVKLPVKFNSFTWVERLFYKTQKAEKKIYHYSGGVNLEFDLNDTLNNLYFKYFVKTPWFNFDTLANFSATFYKFYNEQKAQLLYFTNLLGKKRRAFFVDKNHFEMLKNIFSITDDEEIIETTTPPPPPMYY